MGMTDERDGAAQEVAPSAPVADEPAQGGVPPWDAGGEPIADAPAQGGAPPWDAAGEPGTPQGGPADESLYPPPAPARSPWRDRLLGAAFAGLIALVALLAALSATPPRADPERTGARPPDAPVVIRADAPWSWDPARNGDAGSAAMLVQVWDGLTALDANGTVRPSLADRWTVEDGGRRVVFHLRDGAVFSDGTPIRAEDVRWSWARLLDPGEPSPLAWLVADIAGARAILEGRADPTTLGVRGDGRDVIVDLERPAAWLPAAAGSPSMAVAPEGTASFGDRLLPPDVAVSGAWRPAAADGEGFDLVANERWWAGPPPLPAIRVLTDDGGRSPVEVFRSGDADWTDVAAGDATWLRWDASLGPSLRRSDDLAVRMLLMDTRTPPLNDRLVRRAIAHAVDWDRIVALEGARPAGSLVPEGIPLRAPEDVSPVYDPELARQELAAAGFPGGIGLEPLVLAGSGSSWEEAAARELERELGIEVHLEVVPFSALGDRLATDPPDLWSMVWVADFPHPYDFLGLLLGEGSPSNETGWSDPRFEAALDAAAASADPAIQEAAYLDAARIVGEEVPIIPISYGETWALAREGLLGADPSRVGLLRFSGLAWAEGR